MTSKPTIYHPACDNADLNTENVKFIEANAEQGNPASVLKAMDQYAIQIGGVMHVGNEKGPLIINTILPQWTPQTLLPSEADPIVMVELGAFLGYSAIQFSSALVEQYGAANVQYHSIEVDVERVQASRAAIQFAGLSNVVTVHVGPLQEHLCPAGFLSSVPRLDIVFIDHVKSLYTTDAKLLLDSGKLVKGSMLIADNVITPGAPEYLQFVRSHSGLQSRMYETVLEYTNGLIKDGVEVSFVL